MTNLIAKFKPILWIVLVAFLFNTLNPPPVQADVAFLPAPGKLIALTSSFSPPLIRGLKIFKNNAFKFEFIMSEGDAKSSQDNDEDSVAKQAFLKEEGNRLVKYFLASLTVPEKDMWVNLSPYERNRIIPPEFGLTEMGKELLAQDYLLKQVTASVMYPEGNVGREFWRLIYQEAFKRFGTTNISVNTFNKVWIVPESAVVYENALDNTVVIVESKLNVMLEEDYLALNKSASKDSVKDISVPDRQLSNELIRQVILPLLKKEVNTGKNFAVLRQVYSSLILALWFKNKLKQSLISKGFVDRKKTKGVEVADKNVDQEIYSQYLKSYKKGVYNYIKEEISPTNEVIPRKYFSGGVAWGNTAEMMQVLPQGPDSAQLAKQALNKLKMFSLTVGVEALSKGSESDLSETKVNLTDLETTAKKAEQAGPAARFDFQEELKAIQQAQQPEDKPKAFNNILAAIDKDELTLTDQQTKGLVVKAWDIILADIVNGKLDLSDTVLSSVVNSILAFHRTGNGAIIREHIQAYQKLLEQPNRMYTVLSPQPTAMEREISDLRANLKEEQLKNIDGLLYIMQEEYLSLEPLEAINDLELLPFEIQGSDVHPDVEKDAAKHLAAAREGIGNILEHLSWDNDNLFSREPVSVKITEGSVLKYNEISDRIEIGEDALTLDQEAFSARLYKEFRKALIHRMAQDLGNMLGANRDTQDSMEGKMALIASKGTSLSEFILFCNISEELNVKKVSDFLDLVLSQGELGYDKLEQYIGLRRHVEGRARTQEAYENVTEPRWSFLNPVLSFLKEHPAVAMIPIIIIAAAGSLHAADLNHVVLPHNGPDITPAPPTLVLDHVIGLGSHGADVTNIGSALLDHVTPADIQNLTGNNPITGRPYDSPYLSQNAGRIIHDAQASIQQGVFNTAVQDAVVAYQHAHGLAEDGSIGIQVVNKLNSVENVTGETIAGLFGNSPEVSSALSSLNPVQKITVGGTTGHVPTAVDLVKQGGPITGPQPVVNSGAVYVGQLDQQISKAQDDITAAAKALQDNLNEQQELRAQIQTPAAAGGAPPPDDIAAGQRELVREYHLSVPNLASVPLPYQTPGMAPPIAQFQPDAVGVAWIDYQLNQIQKDHPEVKNLSPIKGLELLSNNRDYVSLPIGGGQATFNIEPDLPFRSFLSLSQMGKGFANFGAQSTLNQVAGPLFASQIMLNLRNEIETHKLRGQDVRYDARMRNHASGIVQSLTVHVVPIRSFDQRGNLVEEHLYSVGLVDTIQAALGKLDNVLGGKGFIGDNRNHFVTSNLGYQIKVNDYHQAFTHAARFNKDANATYINVYNIDDAATRYRKNAHNGWENVSPSTPLNPRLDFYSATVNGFVLHVDPATGKITGQRVYTSATFVTGAYAQKLTQENGTKITGNSYLDPKSTFMERVSSIDDLKQERILSKGVDAQGRVIWGVLRDPVTGRIKEFITDPMRLNEISRLKDAQGRTVVRFVPGANYKAPSGVGNFLKDYTADEFNRVLGEYGGLLHSKNQSAPNNSAAIISKRPQLTQIPPGLGALFQNQADIFNPSIALTAVTQAARDHFGMIYFVDGQIPAVLTSMDRVKTLGSLDESNGVLKVSDGVYTLAGSDYNLDGKTLVFLDEQGKVSGIVDPSDKLRQERINNLDIDNQHIAVWQEGLQNYGVGIDQDNNLRAFTQPATEFIPARFAGDGVVGQVFGVKKVVIVPDMLVRIDKQDGRNIVAEILQSGQKTMELWKQGMENYGVAIDQNNNARALMEPATSFIPARFAGDGVVGQSFGALKTVTIKGDMLVRVVKQDNHNVVAEIMQSGQKTEGLWNQGMANYGVAIDGHNNLRPLLSPTEDFIPAKYAGQGVVGQVFGDNQVVIAGDVMVRFTKVNGRNIVVEILEPGKKTIADHQAVLRTLAQGSIEAVDQRSVDPRTGNNKVIYFARGNKLTAEQKALNFHPEKELVELVLKGQATTVPAEGTHGKRRWIILKSAPASSLRETLQGHHAQAQGQSAGTSAQTPKTPTLLGPDGKAFHGVTVTTEVFTQANIPELNSINATAIRTYYPIPADLVREIMAKTKVRTFIVGIPYNSFAYNTDNLSNFWGKPVPAEGQRITLQANNYLPYLEQLRKTVGPGAEIVVDLGNEINLHMAWLGKPDNPASQREMFGDINRRAREIKAALPNIRTTFTLGDREEDYTLALQSAPDIDVWGVNYYRHNKTLTDTIQKATQAAGIHRPFYIAEMGIDSTVGDSRQASMVTQDMQLAREMGISNVLMTLRDDPNKKGSEAFWGLYDKEGKPKQVVTQIQSGQVGPRGVSAGTLAELSRDSFLVTLKDRKGSVYISLDQLKDPEIYDLIRQEASEVTMVGANQEVTARVYLSKNIYGSRIEVMQANHTSLVFELPSFSPTNLANPVAKTSSVTDPQGLLHVTTTDLRPVNANVVVEDVYQPVKNAAPIKIYSDRKLQQERIYFKNGHEEYSVSLDTKAEPGQAVMIDGTNVEHVTGIYHFEGVNNTGSGYYIGLRNIEKNGWFAPIRLSTFTDGQITLDQTGFVKIESGSNGNEIIQRAQNSGVLNMKDEYTYQGNGQFDSRKISFLVNGSWQTGWALKGSDIAPQTALVEQLSRNDAIAQAFTKNKINKDTVFTKTLKTTSDGGITEDYRVAGDVLEKKVFTIIKQDGVVVKMIVGLDYNAQSGEQVLSYTLAPDGQVQSFSRTLANNVSFMNLLPSGVAEQYAQYMKEHMNVSNADLGADLSAAGVATGFVPVMIEETPFMIQSDNHHDKGYKLIEPQIRPLIKSYMAADAQARPAILERITDILREYHRGTNAAHYTNLTGKPTTHFLAPPNDSRGRDFITKMSNGDIVLDLWWLEGKGGFKANILPGSIVVNSAGKLQRTMVFDHDSDMVFKNAQGEPHTLHVNTYNVFHDPTMTQIAFTSLGQRVFEKSRYVINRVVNGQLGVQTKGEETIQYDPLSPYAMPILGTLDDGRLTKVVMHLEYSAANGEQQIVESSDINEPTAPGDFKIKTQTIVGGKPVVGSLHQEETFKTYFKDVVQNWKLYIVYPGMLLGLFITGDFIKRKRLARIKEELAATQASPEIEQTQENLPEREIVYPAGWNLPQGPNAYGFSKDAVEVAKARFEGTIVPMLRHEPLEDVLNDYFNGYKIWRKQVMGIEQDFNPTIEDLWIMLLRDVKSEIFSADVPDGLNYLMHKAIEAKEMNQANADIGGFIGKEYERWHHIIELQQTSFQGMSAGTMKHVNPYDYYFTVEDLNEMFRTRANIEWYDSLGYSLDGNPDLRSAIYDDFIMTLDNEIAKLKKGISNMAGEVDNNVFKMKRKLTSVPAFTNYLKFFSMVQNGGYQVSDQFNFPGVTRQEADQRINNKPLIRKTFSESGSWVGRMPLPVRILKPAAQFVRNSYNQLTYPIALTSTVGLFVAAYDGLMTWGAAAITAAIGFFVIKALYYPLSYLLDHKLNTKSFGKPADFWAGYKKQELTSEQKWYRGAFWTLVISAKVTWDAFLLHNFLIPSRETLGAAYYPVIAGHQLPIDLNVILMGMLWSTSAIFLYVSSYAANYLVKPFFTFTHGAIRGLGTIKTAEDIRRLQEDDTLNRLIEQKFLPRGGAGLTTEQRNNARRAIIKLVFDQHRNVRDEISDEEYNMAVEQGRFDHIKIPEVQKNIAQAVNSLIMDMPQMPAPDDNTPISVLTPVYGEDIIYAYDNSALPTTLDMMLNNGYTNLNYIISKAPQRWANLIERVERQGIANEDELSRMRNLQHNTGKLGEINDVLKMQIRLWASYEGQPFARTLDGLMNIVRWHQLYLKISDPDLTDQQIRERTNKDVQLIWAFQIWGDILKANDQQPDNQLKRQDTLFLMKKYYDELGFLVDIVSLQNRNGVNVKVLSRYNPLSNEGAPFSEQIKDVWVIPMTQYKAIPLEGKPANQMHAMSFARNKFRFTIDVNQDLDPMEAIKIPIVIQEFKNKNVAIVNVPETIFTSTFSKTGDLHAFSDRTFVTSDKRHMGMISSPSHHGHPDVWRDTDITEHGGVSSTVAVSEDYKGGVRLMLRGRTILNREYMQWKKGRELSWTGTDGIWRKFSMGAAQLLLGRYAGWMNKYFGPIAGAGEFYSGPHYYTLNTIAALGFFVYTINVMITGISPFTAFPAPFVSMMTGVLWVGQAITVIGITQMVLEEGIKKGLERFFKLLPFIVPFYVAHIFTLQAGFISGLAGLAAYVATGRGFNRENLGIDKLLKAFSKSHVVIGAAGFALSAYAFNIWRNETFLLSMFTVLSFIFPMIMPFVMNPGNYPIHGVTVEKSINHFKENTKEGLKTIRDNFWTNGLAKGDLRSAVKKQGLKNGLKEAWTKTDLRKSLVDTVTYSIAYGVWFTVTAPVALSGMALKAIKGKPRADNAMTAPNTEEIKKILDPGGIDLGKTIVSVKAGSGVIQTAFDDPAMLRLLLNADGLAPIIYNIRTMTPSMVDHFVGVDQ